ncbi:MAG TPA: hypothetical protein DCZ10_12495 [Pelotomaculum sp.]|jgi:hypothetical protein|nr:hypothetical protein [Pelotomaculum sp.]
MELIKKLNLEILVYKYEDQAMQASHADNMLAQGYEIGYMGECYLGTESTTSSFCNKSNWYLTTEFKKEKKEELFGDYQIQTIVY